MFKFDWLLLPLAAGFVFATKWHPTHVSIQRSSGYKLFFITVVTGLILLAVASLISIIFLGLDTAIVETTTCLFCHNHNSKPHPVTYILAALLGFTMWWPLNRCCDLTAEQLTDEEERQWVLHNKLDDKDWLTILLIKGSRISSLNRAITKKGDGLETLLRQTIYDRTNLIFTLKSDKVYIGSMASALNPAHDKESLHIYLERSGYYRESDLTVVFTHDYRKIRKDSIRKFIKNNKNLLPEDNSSRAFIIRNLEATVSESLTIAIPFNELRSVTHYYDPNPKELLHTDRQGNVKTKRCIVYRFIMGLLSAPSLLWQKLKGTLIKVASWWRRFLQKIGAFFLSLVSVALISVLLILVFGLLLYCVYSLLSLVC